MKIQIKLLTDTAKVPQRMSELAAGYDLYADIQNDIILKPLERVLISTGFAVSLPKGFEAQIRPRSGLAINHGITVLNSPGTIDSDYRGEVKVILVNLSNEDYVIEKYSRIAQMVISEIKDSEFVLASGMLDKTNRNDGGFGHTKNK